MNKKVKSKKLENVVYNIIMFTLIFALVISFVFTIDKLFLERPKDNCYLQDYNYKPEVITNIDANCSYNQEYINSCYKSEGNIVYKKDCQMECSYCYRDYNKILETYNNRINIGRMIFTFLLALLMAFILIKDKIIRYSILSASLVSLFVATISATKLLNKMLPVVIIAEFLLVIFIYRKTSKEKK
ncbi:MAG TPA: hypothetical protein PLK55_03245 [archaeon]|jgi:hypothetical protein|nr:hypothetical protein [archaeon]HOZ35972.1 hypothetical protein [archaeon]